MPVTETRPPSTPANDAGAEAAEDVFAAASCISRVLSSSSSSLISKIMPAFVLPFHAEAAAAPEGSNDGGGCCTTECKSVIVASLSPPVNEEDTELPSFRTGDRVRRRSPAGLPPASAAPLVPFAPRLRRFEEDAFPDAVPDPVRDNASATA
jgi:hypothetical protein